MIYNKDIQKVFYCKYVVMFGLGVLFRLCRQHKMNGGRCMNYNVISKKVELSDSRKEKLLKKIQKLDKFFSEDNDCKIAISEQRGNIIIEITILHKGFILRAEARDKDLLVAADECLANLDRQIRKNKTKLAKQIREPQLMNFKTDFSENDSVSEETGEFKIIRRKKFTSKPMSAEEAVLQMNMLGHDFFVFADPETMETNIVYRRKDGNYGLIETE